MTVALVCIAKNENYYIEEWIDYHIKLGFDKIFIYANDWSFKTKKIKVKTHKIMGYGRQLPAYKDFIKKYHKTYDWGAFLDVDEFLCLKKHDDVKDFIEQYKEYNCIGINWIVFGDNGLKDVRNGEYSVLKRFTKRSMYPSSLIKSIVKLNKNLYFDNPHHPSVL